jgi:DNA invertase Pin-like site-specific DNA recombinase
MKPQSRADRGQEQDSGQERAAPVVAAYVRVSSKSQDAAYQRDAIERAARARGEEIDVWFSDVASGRSMDRPELSAALAAIRVGMVRRLWVWRVDRLTRSGIVDTLTVLEDMRRHGCVCASVADGFALDGPAADVILAVLAWAAQMEREKIAENQAAARARMEAVGRAWGRPIIGVTAEQIAHVLELRAAGCTQLGISRRTELSVRRVARILRESEPQAAAENMPVASAESVRR